MPMIIQPFNSLIRHQLTGITFQMSDYLSVPNKVIWILMTGRCIIPCGEPVIKAMMTGSGLRPVLCRQTQMPFSNTGSLVSRTLDQFCKSDLTRRHPPPFAPARITPRQQSGTRGSTNRLRVEGCKHSPLLGQLIKSWSLICLTAIAPQVGVSLIIRKNDYDIGLFSVGYRPNGNGYKKGQKNSHSPIRNNFKITETQN